MLHRNMPLGDGHIIHNWEAADATAKAAIVPVASDKGKLLWQKDTNVFYFLVNEVGPVWLAALGVPGPTGTAGKTVLNGVVAPIAGDGVNGDFFLNTATSTLYGPKAAGAWPAGVSLVGATGPSGIPEKFTYATAAARLVSPGNPVFVAGDIGRLAYQVDTKSFWVLMSTLPTWSALTGIQIVETVASSAIITIDARTSQVYDITLTSNTTLDLANGIDGQIVVVRVKQDAVGSRTLTPGASIRFGSDITIGSLVLTTGANKMDYLGFRFNAVAGKFDIVGLMKGY